jgi:hypothetical protein
MGIRPSFVKRQGERETSVGELFSPNGDTGVVEPREDKRGLHLVFPVALALDPHVIGETLEKVIVSQGAS